MAWFVMKRKRCGMSMVEVMAVVGVIAILLAMGYMVLRSMRLAARVAVAETRLKQVATGLELYLKEYGTYPPQGSDLVAELTPFVENPTVFNNPLLEEETPGETVNVLYHQPTVDEIDSPDNYVTAMMADNGRTLVVLKTGNKIVRRDDLRFSPDDPSEIVDVLDPTPPPPEPPADDGEDDSEEPEGGLDVDNDGEVTTRMCPDVTIGCICPQFGYADGTFVDTVVEANLENGWRSLYNGQPVHGGESFSQQSVLRGAAVTPCPRAVLAPSALRATGWPPFLEGALPWLGLHGAVAARCAGRRADDLEVATRCGDGANDDPKAAAAFPPLSDGTEVALRRSVV